MKGIVTEIKISLRGAQQYIELAEEGKDNDRSNRDYPFLKSRKKKEWKKKKPPHTPVGYHQVYQHTQNGSLGRKRG